MKKYIESALVALALVALGMTGAFAQETSPRPYEGQRITLLAGSIPDIIDPLQDLIPEFEAATGIDVEIETVPESQHLTKEQLVLSTGSTEYDVFLTASINAVGYIEPGWFTPIENHLEEDFDLEDFPPLLLELLSHEGQLYGLPIRAETLILMYRADILEELGVPVPTTLAEYEEAAHRLTEETPDNFFGTALRGAKNQGGYTYAYYLRNMGGKFFDEDMNPVLDSVEAAEALEYYVRLAQEYSPRGSAVYAWEDVFSAMQLGRVGMIIESSIQAGTLEDPEKSTVVGNVGYAVPPAGPGGNFPDLKTYGYFISSFSQNPGAAAEFVTWATGQRVQRYAFDEYNFAAITRNSVMEEAFDEAPFFQAIRDAMDVGYQYYLPPIAELGQLYTTTSDAVSNALAGTQTPEDALNEANERIKGFMEDAGYYDDKPIPAFIQNGGG